MQVAWKDSRRAFADAAAWFTRITSSVGQRWELPALGEWDVRDLVGHTSRSLLTVEEYLAQPAAGVELEATADYYRATRQLARGPGVADRGRKAGAALGDAPATAIEQLATRVLQVLDGCDGSELVTTIAGGMRLDAYLPTRVFELAVHTTDLAAALGLPADIPVSVARQALELVVELATGDGLAGPLLLATTGRRALPPGFSVL
jgi:uncharacterized protein (TIGR03083 family)